jgi:carbonic anhydrase
MYKLNQQSPINIKPMEMTEFAPQFNVRFNYNNVKDLQLENILWTVRVSILKNIVDSSFDGTGRPKILLNFC